MVAVTGEKSYNVRKRKDKIMKKEQQVEKMSCNCQQLAEEWLMKHNTDKENTEIIKSAENKKGAVALAKNNR